jgi:TolB-like protein/DNA-binding winged helix-turn-helix (wHTH) protein/Tfp pilus assembly protein PilF
LYEFGPFVFDPAERTLLREGRRVKLRPKVFDTLLVLVENNGRLVEKEELMQAVWPGQIVEEGNLNKNVSMLREALGEGRSSLTYIETEPKRGYRFVAAVRTVSGCDEAELVIETRTRESLVLEEETDDDSLSVDGAARAANAVELKSAMETTAPLAQLSGKSKSRFKAWMAPAAAGLLIVLVAAYFFYPRPGGEAIDSVAVLPFVNESGDPDAEYLSDGISESLINSLSQLSGVKVIARNSTFKYKGKEIDPREVARSLGVRAILLGKVSRRGDRLDISVELMDVPNNTQIWGARYNRHAKDIFAVQAEISREIAGKLHLRLTAGEQKQLARRETVSPVAYELLLKGNFYFKKGGTENGKKAVGYFQQAIAVDPAYALAYARLSMAYSELINTNVLDPKEFTPKAEMAAREALELDDSLAEGHVAMAEVNLHAWEWAAAEREHRRAIELNPNLASAHQLYMFYLCIQGRIDEALAEGRRTRELDPLSLRPGTTSVYELFLLRRFDQAIEFAKKLLEQDRSNPDMHALLAYAYANNGQYAQAIAAYQEAIKLGDDSRDTQAYLSIAYAKAGEPRKAREVLKRLATGKEYVSPATLSGVYATLGEREQAFALLERAYSAHDQQLIWMGIDIVYDALRSDPRFQDIMRRVGLSQS